MKTTKQPLKASAVLAALIIFVTILAAGWYADQQLKQMRRDSQLKLYSSSEYTINAELEHVDQPFLPREYIRIRARS